TPVVEQPCSTCEAGNRQRIPCGQDLVVARGAGAGFAAIEQLAPDRRVSSPYVFDRAADLTGDVVQRGNVQQMPGRTFEVRRPVQSEREFGQRELGLRQQCTHLLARPQVELAFF